MERSLYIGLFSEFKFSVLAVKMYLKSSIN